MTISYTGAVHSARPYSYLGLILRWRGSIWKSIYCELGIWMCSYYAVKLIYSQLLNASGRSLFESVAKYADTTDQYIPLSFLLGFFVKAVVDRWRQMFDCIGFIDKCAHMVCTVIRGVDPAACIQRRNILRYLCLVQLFVLRDISVRVRKHFPTIESIVHAGLLERHELSLLHRRSQEYGSHWIPFNWACQLCFEARQSGRITADPVFSSLMQQLMEFRDHLQKLLNFDWVPIPLAYPQVVFLAVRVYFFICLFSRQHLPTTDPAEQVPFFQPYFPLMTILQYIFYMGWTKVGEELLNPLGEDDDDFETMFVFERNLHIALSLANDSEVPEQRADALDQLSRKSRAEHRLVGGATMLMPSQDEAGGAQQQQQKGGSVREKKQLGDQSNGGEAIP